MRGKIALEGKEPRLILEGGEGVATPSFEDGKINILNKIRFRF